MSSKILDRLKLLQLDYKSSIATKTKAYSNQEGKSSLCIQMMNFMDDLLNNSENK